MNFLLTNDDGIAAPGLWAAARALAALGRVLIVAPSSLSERWFSKADWNVVNLCS